MCSSSQNRDGGERALDVDVSVVIPCYQDESKLGTLFERLRPVMRELEPCELVLVDDGSSDGTRERAITEASEFEFPVTVVGLARNFGQHPAVFAGFEYSQGRIVVTMDSDLQYPPEEIPALLAGFGEGVMVVSGVREQRRDPWVRRLITRLLSWWLGRRTGVRLRDFGSMFRAYDRRVVEQLLTFTERRRFVPGLVAWLGVPIREIPVRHEPRGEQGSRYRLGALVDMFLDLITGYSVAPLRSVSVMALLGAAMGFLATVTFAVYRLFIGVGVSGTVSAFALVFLLLGLQLLVVAMLGEYVGRIYNEVKARPYYLVADVVRHE